MSGAGKPVLVLDAMGVLYRRGDDVDDLLVPFIAEAGGSRDVARINALYLEASLGTLAPDAFWTRVGLSAAVEDRYLARHELFPGLLPFLRQARQRFSAIACLSNDVGRWSLKLRERHGLTAFIPTWVLSGDVGMRKPDAGIYRLLLDRLGAAGEQTVFVDDRPANLDAARRHGMRTVHMQANGGAKAEHGTDHERARSMEELQAVLAGMR